MSIFVLLGGCGGKPGPSSPGLSAGELLGADGDKVLVADAAADERFLLRAVYHDRDAGAALRSRVVRFEFRGNRAFLVESPESNERQPEVRLPTLLAELPVLERGRGYRVLDFGDGLKRVVGLGGDMVSPPNFESPLRVYKREERFLGEVVRLAYLEKVERIAPSTLAMKQVAQLARTRAKLDEKEKREIETEGEENVPVAIHYCLSPYRPDPTFPKLPAVTSPYVGFFETPPLQESNKAPFAFTTRFHPKKVVDVALSANMPEKVREAVREGVLYWNRALGRELVRVVDAPKGVSAPTYRFNLIHWVEDDTSGAAYTTLQADPLTGEILWGEIFLPSLWYTRAQHEIRGRLHRLVDDTGRVPASKRIAKLAAPACRYEAGRRKAAAALLRAAAENGVSDETLARLSLDDLRGTVAHEVGHLLGLTHNFAGSLALSTSLASARVAYENYVRTGKRDPKVVTTSTVMEYERFEDGVLTGGRVQAKEPALPYDAAAVRYLYGGEKLPSADVLGPFCEDSEERLPKGAIDCRKFDAGRSPVEFAIVQTAEAIRALPFQTFERFVEAKSPPEGVVARDAEDAVVDTDNLAFQAVSPFSTLTRAFQKSSRLLAVRYRTPGLPPGMGDAERRFVAAQLSAVTGHAELPAAVRAAFAVVPEDFEARFVKELVRLSKLPTFRKGTDAAGDAYEFSDDELKVIERRAPKIARELHDALYRQLFRVVRGELAARPSEVQDHALGRWLAEALAVPMRRVLLAIEGEKPRTLAARSALELSLGTQPGLAGVGTAAMVFSVPVVPRFRFPYDVRNEAAVLLGSRAQRFGESAAWGAHSRVSIADDLEKLANERLGRALKKTRAEDFPQPEGGDFVEETVSLLQQLRDAPPIWDERF